MTHSPDSSYQDLLRIAIDETLKQPDLFKKKIAEHLSPQDSLGLSQEVMAELYRHARYLLEKGAYSDASCSFLFLITLNPSCYEYWLGFGMAEQMDHAYDAAIDAYEVAASCELENPVPYFYLAKCLFSIHDRDSALKALELAIELSGDQSEYELLKSQAETARATLIRD